MQLKDLIGETFVPKAGDEKRFWDKHVVTKFKNIYSDAEYDKLFGASNVKQSPREKDRHGYSSGNDEKVYEETKKKLNESIKVGDTVHHYLDSDRRNPMLVKHIASNKNVHVFNVETKRHEVHRHDDLLNHSTMHNYDHSVDSRYG